MSKELFSENKKFMNFNEFPAKRLLQRAVLSKNSIAILHDFFIHSPINRGFSLLFAIPSVGFSTARQSVTIHAQDTIAELIKNGCGDKIMV